MTNSEQAIREFAENWGDYMEVDEQGRWSLYNHRNEMYNALTALISERYYPKEFTEWAIGLGRSAFDDRYYHYISVQNPNMPFKETKELEFDDLDDAFNYWKENER